MNEREHSDATRTAVAEWKAEQARRCRRWIGGVQCHLYRMPSSNYCALHGRGRAG